MQMLLSPQVPHAALSGCLIEFCASLRCWQSSQSTATLCCVVLCTQPAAVKGCYESCSSAVQSSTSSEFAATHAALRSRECFCSCWLRACTGCCFTVPKRGDRECNLPVRAHWVVGGIDCDVLASRATALAGNLHTAAGMTTAAPSSVSTWTPSVDEEETL